MKYYRFCNILTLEVLEFPETIGDYDTAARQVTRYWEDMSEFIEYWGLY